ncbi:sensor histidine kinase [Flaviaesturariibacter amylovorans]|uniref:Signal transduction histidine kinase internal region domain-containing protein n=1 Tax=Flaviaesturariibacter amylovorans TaxID=1084520 RepID=A0ABP8HH73_9BACT
MAHQEISTIYRRFRNGLLLFWVLFAASNLLQQYVARTYLVPNQWCEYMPSVWRFTLWTIVSVYLLRYILLVRKDIPRFDTAFVLKECGLAFCFFALSYVVETGVSFLYMEQTCRLSGAAQANNHERFLRLVTNAYLTRLNYYLLVYIAIKGFAYFLRAQHERKQRELEQSRLLAELNELKLQFLNMQIRPHFLFNAHHAIISLIEQGEVKQASSMLVRLSTLLRNVLQYSNRNSITLQEELDNLRNYVQLQQLRFGEGIDVRFDVDAECGGFAVPPLLLQPVVENAFHHAFSNREEGLLEIAVSRDGEGCRISIRDDGHGFAPKAGGEPRIGLSNVHKRILNYYGSNARFSICARPVAGTEATFILPA